MMSESSAPPAPRSTRLVSIVLVVCLAATVAIAALPSYFGNAWPWSQPLDVPGVQQLRELFKTPLDLPGWETQAHEEVSLGGAKWSLTQYVQATGENPIAFGLLMRPQTYHTNQPQVEWVDLQGAQGWKAGQVRQLRFTATPDSGEMTATVKARYFRAIAQGQTLAVMQWYARPDGGSAAPGDWFWADQWRQWRHRERMPWVAIAILLPIEPVGNIADHQDTAIALGQAVQTALMETPFQELTSPASDPP